jgi:hypothetical protein
MAIKVYNNKIMIGSYTIQEGSGGLVFDGSIKAESLLREGSFQGSVAGFASGGYIMPGGSSNVIDKYPFATSTSNATDHGDLTQGRYGATSQSSDLHGYTSGGATGGPSTNTIDKFAFAYAGNASDVGDLSEVVYTSGGSSSKQFGLGFGAGRVYPTSSNIIQKIPFSVDSFSFDIGDLSVARGFAAGQSSTTHAYNSGGEPTSGATALNVIDKFPMAATSYALASDVGDLASASTRHTGQSSTTHGYSSGGGTWPPGTSGATIQKFLFASDSNATSVGSLTAARWTGSGSSSTVEGYTNGGNAPPSYTNVSTIDKFPFSTDFNAVSVGSLTVARGLGSGGFQI